MQDDDECNYGAGSDGETSVPTFENMQSTFHLSGSRSPVKGTPASRKYRGHHVLPESLMDELEKAHIV